MLQFSRTKNSRRAWQEVNGKQDVLFVASRIQIRRTRRTSPPNEYSFDSEYFEKQRFVLASSNNFIRVGHGSEEPDLNISRHILEKSLYPVLRVCNRG